tara:strand:+ start:584 stop:1102 length:519 start_codon:yes stop_codon:yes gene_type:complete
MKVIDDFLSIPDFDKLKQYLCGPNFQWYLQSTIANGREGLDQYQFTHSFFNIRQPHRNDWSTLLDPVVDTLKAKYIFRIKANCRPRTTQGVLSEYHTDMPLNQQTAILYLNTNNGYTKFKDNMYDDVKSVANRLVTFHGGLEHAGSSCTDDNTRIVLNINYIPTIGSSYLNP